uniref:SMP-30/Gluconolactonase/LRE-like region domain-containing protein n=1 Tax=Alexandrium monilatum TaxID=311494 RepID=A0A7S4R9E6_9DINO
MAGGAQSSGRASVRLLTLIVTALTQGNSRVSAVLVRVPATPSIVPAHGANSTLPFAVHPVTPLSALPQPPLYGRRDAAARPAAFAQLTPLQFLIISSPRERKIVYTELSGFRSTTGRTFTLIDSGLREPGDIAFDRQRGHLYVVDRAQHAVFRYSLLVDTSGSSYKLQTDGTRLTIMANRLVGGLTVDVYGTVFFTDETSSSVNKIPARMVERLGAADLLAEDLRIVPEEKLENISSAHAADAMVARSEATTTEPPRQALTAQSLYEAGASPHVSGPTGVASDGMRLFWANGLLGRRAGVVVEGQASPEVPPLTLPGGRPAHFPTAVVASNTDAAYDLVQAGGMLLFSGEYRGSGVVFGVDKSGGPVFRCVSGLGKPRGLAWDGDGTAYVADEGGSRVYSFPVGRHADGAPVTPAVDFSGAHGLALVSREDEAWSFMQTSPAARRFAWLPPMLLWPVLIVLLLSQTPLLPAPVQR